jgi:NAD-dependent deacetylase
MPLFPLETGWYDAVPMASVTPSSRLIALLKGRGSVLVLTGAGVSRESGIATFRDAGGLWEGVDPMQVATPRAFAADPSLVWRFYDARRARAAAAQPNPAHRAIAALEATGRPFLLATQNVDGLHERAGSKTLVRLHGSLWRVRCTACAAESDDLRTKLDPLPPRCSACGAMLRPAVVWFEEALPMIEFGQAQCAAREAELVLVVGTSSLVYPAASLQVAALEAGAYVVEINPETTSFSTQANEHLAAPAGVVLPALLLAAGISMEQLA